MAPIERTIARCTLGALTGAPEAEIVLCSRFGNLERLVALLRCLVEREPVSPMVFSLSVHNTLVGLIGQIRGDRSPHTALASGRETLAAGFDEAYCKLTVAPARPLVLVYEDAPLPGAYARFSDEAAATTALALLFRANEDSRSPITLEALADSHPASVIDGSTGIARRLVSHLQDGTELVFRWRQGPSWRVGPR